jgi:hypothetical protein
MAKKYYKIVVKTDGNYDTKIGLGSPVALLIEDNKHETAYFGFENFPYPSSFIAETSATSLGIYAAAHYCEMMHPYCNKINSIVENDSTEVVALFNSNGKSKKGNDRHSYCIRNSIKTAMIFKKFMI